MSGRFEMIEDLTDDEVEFLVQQRERDMDERMERAFEIDMIREDLRDYYECMER